MDSPADPAPARASVAGDEPGDGRGSVCPGDFNLDGLVNELDYIFFPLCMTGPAAPLPLGCQVFDFDGSGSVDVVDFAVMAEVFRQCVGTDGECLIHAQCDDGLYCNGAERCDGGHCVSGTPPCDELLCDEEVGECVRSPCELASPPFLPGEQFGVLPGFVADEVSGMAASRRNFGILWIHNDDYGDNRIMAITIAGALAATYTVGTGAIDPEDMAIGPGPLPGRDYLYLADIGDNDSVRSTIFVKRFLEPLVPIGGPPHSETISAVDVLRFTYPTGATAPTHKDAETLLVDPWNGDIYIVTKRTSVGHVYRAAYPQSTTGTTVLERVASLSWGWPVGGSVSPDGFQVLIRRYSGYNPQASVWTRGPGEPLWHAFQRPRCDVPLATEPQGEAVSWDALGLGYFTLSENQAAGAQIPIWYFARNAP